MMSCSFNIGNKNDFIYIYKTENANPKSIAEGIIICM